MRWNLDKLYTSFESEEYRDDLKDLEEKLLSLNKWMEENSDGSDLRISGSEDIAELLIEYLDRYIYIKKLFSSLIMYAELTFSVDSSDTAAKKYIGILKGKKPDITAAEVRLSRWLAGIRNLKEVCENSGILSSHYFFLKEKAELSRYLMSDREELLAARLKNSGSDSWSMLWNVLTSNLKAEIVINGEKKELPLPEIRNLANDKNGPVRKNAYTAELESYGKIDESAAAALNGIKGEVITLSRARGYKSPLDMTLINSRMEEKTLDIMLSVMKEYLPSFGKYFRKKAEYLGHKNGLPFYDLFAPIGKEGKRFTYRQARKLIVESFGTFSDSLAEYAEKAFEEKWIDAEQRGGKQGGAFCENIHVIGESRIMTNFDGSFSSVITLAHELGHGYHGFQLKEEQFLNSDYPMPLAETASIFCETIVVNAALKETVPEEALFIIENSLQSDSQVIVDIYSRFLFESELFKRRSESLLSVEELKEIMADSQRKAYGDGLDGRYLHPFMWICKPHYYYADYNFYNFPYAFGLLFSRGLYAEYLKTGESFIPRYDKLLRETGKASIKDAALSIGIDVNSPEFWKNSLEMIKDDIDKFSALADDTRNHSQA